MNSLYEKPYSSYILDSVFILLMTAEIITPQTI